MWTQEGICMFFMCAIKSPKGSVGRINNRCVQRFDRQKRNGVCKTSLHANHKS